MISLGLMCASLFTRPVWVNSVSFIIFAVALFTTAFNVVGSNGSSNNPIADAFFNLLPLSHYNTVWNHVVKNTQLIPTDRIDNTTALFQPFTRMEYTWTQVCDNSTDYGACDDFDWACCVKPLKDGKSSPCKRIEGANHSLGILIGLTFGYFFLAWYFSQIVSDDMGGGGRKIWFLLVSRGLMSAPLLAALLLHTALTCLLLWMHDSVVLSFRIPPTGAVASASVTPSAVRLN